MHARYLPWACVRVCVSDTSRCSTKTAKRRITQRKPRGSNFQKPKISAKFDQGLPLLGRQMQVGWVKIGDFWRWLYLENGTSLVMSECSLNGRGRGHVSNFYIVDLENFATASRRYTGDIHNSTVVGLFMIPIGQWKRLDRVMVECTCLLHIPPL